MRTGKRNLILICGLSTGVLETMDSDLFRDNSHVPCATFRKGSLFPGMKTWTQTSERSYAKKESEYSE